MESSDDDPVAGVIALYRDAQRSSIDAFAKNAFAWMGARIRFDRCVVVTGLRGATWVDAHFHGVPDPAALMASHARVRHLDVLSQRMLENPGVVLRLSHDDPEIAGERFAPYRAHLRTFDGRYTMSMTSLHETEGAMTHVMLIRGWPGRDFTKREMATFGVLAPHLVEAFCVNRTRWLGASVGPGDAAPPLALVDAQGRFVQTTPAFVQLFWPREPPLSTYVPPQVLRAIRGGRAYPLPHGAHTLYAEKEATGGWLVRLRPRSAVDELTSRERQIASLFARGVTHKSIARRLQLAPATVRNHLQRVYAKLGITDREGLSVLLGS